MKSITMDRPRVLIFQPALAPYRLHIYNELVKYCTLKVIFLRENLLNQKFDQVKLRSELTVDYEYLTTGFTFLRRSVRFGIKRKINEFMPDVVVTVEYSPATLAVAMFRTLVSKRYAHVVWTDDNTESMHFDTPIRRALRNFIVPRAQGFIVVSKEAAEMYRYRYNARCAVGVVPIIQSETVFTRRLEQAGKTAQRLREHYGFAGKQIILFVGRFAAEKRIDRLIAAHARIRKAHPDAVLVLVGEGPEQENLRALATRLGVADIILFAGRHEGVELAAWYRVGDLFVLASASEPFGAVVNEALLAGMPVICSDKAGARELIRDDVNGEVVDASDEGVLSDALGRWLTRVSCTPANTANALRKSLMPIMFADAVHEFAGVISAALGRDAGESVSV